MRAARSLSVARVFNPRTTDNERPSGFRSGKPRGDTRFAGLSHLGNSTPLATG